MRRGLLFLAMGLSGLCGFAFADERKLPVGDVPIFVEQAREAGIEHSYTGGWEYFVGGGAASFDCNGDRMPDLALAGGASAAAFYVNRSKPGGALSFVPAETGLAPEDLVSVTGFYPLDIDNDGHMDLIALRIGANLLLKGGPDCKFENANRLFAFNGGTAWTTAFAATFEAGSVFPTLAFANYVDRSAPGSPWGTCHDNVLARPQKDDEAPRYDEQIALTPGYCALSMLFTDWDRSGTPALRITNDRQY